MPPASGRSANSSETGSSQGGDCWPSLEAASRNGSPRKRFTLRVFGSDRRSRGLSSASPAGHRCTGLPVGWEPPCGACEARGDAAEHGRKKLTDPISRRKKFPRKKSRRPLETFLGLPNFFGVATAAIGMPSGSRDLSRAPDGVRSLLVPILLQGGFGYEV